MHKSIYHHKHLRIQFPINHVCFTFGLKIIFSDRKDKSNSAFQWLYYPHFIYHTPTELFLATFFFFAKQKLYKLILIFCSIFYNKLSFTLSFLEYSSLLLFHIHLFTYNFLSVYNKTDTMFPLFCTCSFMIWQLCSNFPNV